MTPAERKWLESRGWVCSDEGHDYWARPVSGHEEVWTDALALRIERAAFEAECRSGWWQAYSAEVMRERGEAMSFVDMAIFADLAVREYRARFGPEAFEAPGTPAAEGRA